MTQATNCSVNILIIHLTEMHYMTKPILIILVQVSRTVSMVNLINVKKKV